MSGRKNDEVLIPEWKQLKRLFVSMRTRQTITCTEGTFALVNGIPNINDIEQACRDRGVSIAENGSIRICGIQIRPEWDTARTRRRVEDLLRKRVSPEDIIRSASHFGVKLT